MLIIVVALSLLLYFLEPVILKDNPAAATEGSFAVVVMRTLVGTISHVVSFTDAIFEGMNLHSVNGFEK